jgi:DNA (cytosine-5)-methyltransferase 1
MFGLSIRRHRWFASSHMLFAPRSCAHVKGYYNVIGAKVRGYGDYASAKTYVDAKGTTRRRESYPPKAVGQAALGIDWMTVAEMSEAIPPVYTYWLGEQLRSAIESEAIA